MFPLSTVRSESRLLLPLFCLPLLVARLDPDSPTPDSYSTDGVCCGGFTLEDREDDACMMFLGLLSVPKEISKAVFSVPTRSQ